MSRQETSKLKICFVGWGNSIHTQRWMQWFINNGHEVHLITDRISSIPGITEHDISLADSYSGSRIKRYANLEFNSYYLKLLKRMLKINLIKQIYKIRKIIRDINPDILHLHTLLYPSYLGVFSNVVCPLVVTPWNGDIVWKTQWSFSRKYAVKSGLAKADLITVDSHDLKIKTLQYGRYENKIAYISFGVDTKLFHPEAKSPELRKRLRIDRDAPIVYSNRSFEELYNIDIIIRAIPTVLRVLPKTIFLFSWHSASRKNSLMELAEGLGVMTNVRFIGKIKHDELPGYYAESDVFVTIPSGDTISISLLEAMACSVAPVVSDLSSVRECIKDGVNGYIVPVRDINATAQAVIKLLKDKSLGESFAKTNREWVVQNADWNKNMKKVEELYYKSLYRKH